VVGDFPWPITDDELILNNALTIVMNTWEAHGSHEDKFVREAAANLIVEAYNQGIREPDVLANHALKALSGAGQRSDGG
jgi:hypothetical protein